jgi:hypothetical protein
MGFRSVCYCNKCLVIAIFCYSWKLNNKANTVKQKQRVCKIFKILWHIHPMRNCLNAEISKCECATIQIQVFTARC